MTEEIIIDLTSYKDRFGANVPKDRYRVQVEDVEISESREHNQMLVLGLRIMDGDYEGSRLVDRLTQTENALFRTVAFMNAIGLPTPHKRLLVRPQTWVGKVLYVDVEDGEPYNGRVKSEIRGYMRVERSASPELIDLDEEIPDDAGDLTEFVEETSSNPSGDKARVTVPPAADDAIDLDTVEL